MDVMGTQVFGLSTLILGRHREGTAGAGGGLFENQGDVLTAQGVAPDALMFLALEILRQVKEVHHFGVGQIIQTQQTPPF